MKRVLIIGASGQVGHALRVAFTPEYAVIGASHRHVEGDDARIDLADADSVRGVIEDAQPAVVVLAGGMFHVDGCELDPARSQLINVTGTKVVGAAARSAGASLVFYSTEHVFDGSQSSYRETDAVAPMNVYSRHKVEAENAVRDARPDDHLILRTSSVYGADVHRRNFVVRFVDQVTAGQSVIVADDQWGSPTHAADLARTTRLLVDAGARGTYHATGPEFVDRATFARRICERFGLDASLVVARPASSLGQPAPRPWGVRLDCSRLAAAGVPAFMTIDAGLDTLREWVRPYTGTIQSR